MSSPARQRTREHLLQTAERLFAEEGIAAVSLRRVVAEAGHRNPSAIRYHFGAKEDLLEAIITSRAGSMSARRLELLTHFDHHDPDAAPRGVMEAVVRPFLEVGPSERYYSRFLARLNAERQLVPLFEVVARQTDSVGQATRTITEILADCTAHLPAPIAAQRRSMAMGLALSAIADRHGSGDHLDQLTDEAFLFNIVDAGTAILSTPASEQTLGAVLPPASEA